MPSENVILVRNIYNTFEKRDVQAFWSYLSPDIQIVQSPELPWGGTYLGIEEAKLFFGKLNTHLDNRIALKQVIDGGDRVAMIGRTHGSVRETSQTFDIPVMHLWTFQDQTAMRLEIVVDVRAMQVALQTRA